MEYIFSLYILFNTLYGHISNQYGQIGITYNPAAHSVVAVKPGTPAEAAGLLKGDIVISINGLPPSKASIDGDAGTLVTLVIKRKCGLGKADEILTFVIMRIPPAEFKKWTAMIGGKYHAQRTIQPTDYTFAEIRSAGQ